MSSSIFVQTPDVADHLFLLFHGVGASPQSLEPLGKVLAQTYPNAVIISVQAPDKSDFGQGFQWFSVKGVTEANRLKRIAAVMPKFEETVKAWQQKYALTAAQTTLIGFSQGAIMSLSSTQMVAETLAEKVVSLAGRFAVLPEKAPSETQIHFIHGDHDNVIDYHFSENAHQSLLALGAKTSYELIPGLTHGVNQAMIDVLMKRLG